MFTQVELFPSWLLLTSIWDKVKFLFGRQQGGGNSIRTEQAYIEWIKKFIFYRGKRHPAEMGENEIMELRVSRVREICCSHRDVIFWNLLKVRKKYYNISVHIDMRLLIVSFYHPVKWPTGATGLSGPSDIMRASRLISRNEIKRSHSGLVSMRHCKAALYGATHKVIGQPPSPCGLWRAKEVSSLSGRSSKSEAWRLY